MCPACAAAPRSESLSSGRRKLLVGAYILAALATAILGLTLSGVFAELASSKGPEQQVTDTLLGALMFGPAVGGVACSLSAYDRRLHNPPAVWIAVGWNGLLLAVLLLLAVIGSFS